jgi:hypothetical protein
MNLSLCLSTATGSLGGGRRGSGGINHTVIALLKTFEFRRDEESDKILEEISVRGVPYFAFCPYIARLITSERNS